MQYARHNVAISRMKDYGHHTRFYASASFPTIMCHRAFYRTFIVIQNYAFNNSQGMPYLFIAVIVYVYCG